MQVIRGLHNLRPEHRGCVMTIGNYDGVHLGHRAILQRMRVEADQRGLPVLVTVFEPTPKEFFCPQVAPPRLASLREKLEDLSACGVDRVLCLPFTPALAQLPAEQFVQDVIVDGVGAKLVAIGDDFRFGRERAGNFELLQQLGSTLGFEVQQQDCERLAGERVSSTAVRAYLAEGQPHKAAAMLGQPWRISGRVQLGRQLGRTLDIPTANIALGLRKAAKPAARLGVYAVTVNGLGQALNGVANLGFRPTVAGEGCLLEVHLFDFNQDIYGQRLSVGMMHFLRAEQKFASVDALKAAMQNDIQQAKAFFSAREGGGA
ncbi:MAG: bifunctional riboflavin kinase/FAD synthetase [Nevskiales bacterium]